MTLLNNQLIIFVKTPLPGQCKTRLIPLLGEQPACDFYQSLVSKCLSKLTQLKDINIVLYVYPDKEHDFLQQLNTQYALPMHLQRGNNLGERMHFAMQDALKTCSNVVLIGTDCPLIDKDYISSAFNALNQHDIVFGPASDGGYVLIGANRICSSVFSNIDWSTERVLKQSLNRAEDAGYKVSLLKTLWDIDTPEDYLRYQCSKHKI